MISSEQQSQPEYTDHERFLSRVSQLAAHVNDAEFSHVLSPATMKAALQPGTFDFFACALLRYGASGEASHIAQRFMLCGVEAGLVFSPHMTDVTPGLQAIFDQISGTPAPPKVEGELLEAPGRHQQNARLEGVAEEALLTLNLAEVALTELTAAPGVDVLERGTLRTAFGLGLAIPLQTRQISALIEDVCADSV